MCIADWKLKSFYHVKYHFCAFSIVNGMRDLSNVEHADAICFN